MSKTLQNNAKIAQIESRLNKYSYLTKDTLPGYADARIFQIISSIKRYPDKNNTPSFYHWYILMKQFSTSTLAKWIADQVLLDPEDSLISQFLKLYSLKRDQLTAAQNIIPLTPRPNPQNLLQYDYTIDMRVQHIPSQKINSLRIILEQYKARMTVLEQKNKTLLIRLMCKMSASQSEQMINKVSKCIEYDNIEIKKQKKGKNNSTPLLELSKNS